ncbi:MAG: hypothetical protein DRO11_02800 [Methanobacteriota archaeon]|nr:MAG: hypothetical protein DRO11_02800 [Euryarchaeota archaeon]
MLWKKIFPWIVLLALVVPHVYAQVSVTRELPNTATGGEELLVKLRIVVGETKPSGVIIVEKIPENFGYVTSSPEATFNQVSRELKWVLYGENLKNKEITYTVIPAQGFTGKAVFYGETKTLVGTEEITGDKEVVVVETKPGAPTKERRGISSTPATLVVAVIALLAIALKQWKNRG